MSVLFVFVLLITLKLDSRNAFDDDDSGADEESFDVQNEIQQTADVVENDAAEDDDSKQTEQKNKRARTKIWI